jgi:hypothetical protein
MIESEKPFHPGVPAAVNTAQSLDKGRAVGVGDGVPVMVAIGVRETEMGAQLITRSEWMSLTKTVFSTEVATPTG